MEMRIALLIFQALASLVSLAQADHTFIVRNWCAESVWVGILSNGGVSTLPMNGGFLLNSGMRKNFTTPVSWGGRLWGRTGCDASGQHCETGDCGALRCNGAGGAPPVSLAEFTLDAPGDFYDVSLVDGYNLPMNIHPILGTYTGVASAQHCGNAGCQNNLLLTCPAVLAQKNAAGKTIACQSACSAFKTEEFCCSGAHGTPDTCPPTSYSNVFKAACPRSYAYAYDDATSTYTCNGMAKGMTGYKIIFCPYPKRV